MKEGEEMEDVEDVCWIEGKGRSQEGDGRGQVRGRGRGGVLLSD